MADEGGTQRIVANEGAPRFGEWRRYLPHLLALGLLLGALGLVGAVLLPLGGPLLLAGALALIAYPVLHQPLLRLAARLLPRLGEGVRRNCCALATTGVLLAIAALPLLLLIGQPMRSGAIVAKLLTRDRNARAALEGALSDGLGNLHALVPALRLDQSDLPQRLTGLVVDALNPGPSMLVFLSAGSGAAARLVLAVIAVVVLLAEGPRLVGRLLLPVFGPEGCARMAEQHRASVLRLLHDTVLAAAVRGLVLGLLAWSFFAACGVKGLPAVPLILLASVLALLPVVGTAIVYLPLATLLWTHRHPVAAVLFALVCAVVMLLLEHQRLRLGRQIIERDGAASFLLFLSLIGGVLAFGPAGFAIGPAAVLACAQMLGAWRAKAVG